MNLINKVKDAYYNLPGWLIETIAFPYYCIPGKIRYGNTFRKTIEEIKKIEALNPDQIRMMQNQKFVEIVQYAYNHVPFYKNYYDEWGGV